MGLSLEAPDHATLSRRSKGLDAKLIPIESKKPIHLTIDSTGRSIVGEGEWAAAKHRGRGKRRWRKLHIGVARAGMVRAQVLTDSAAYDTVAIYDQADFRGVRVVVPPTRSASVTGCSEDGAGHRLQDLEPVAELGQTTLGGPRSLNSSAGGGLARPI